MVFDYIKTKRRYMLLWKHYIRMLKISVCLNTFKSHFNICSECVLNVCFAEKKSRKNGAEKKERCVDLYICLFIQCICEYCLVGNFGGGF